MTVDDGIPEPRQSAYDLDAAVAELAVPGLEFGDQLDGTVLAPYDPEWVTALFEHMAGRGEPPGDPRRASPGLIAQRAASAIARKPSATSGRNGTGTTASRNTSP